MAKRVTLESTLTFRLTVEEREQMEALQHDRESLGEFAREAVVREIARRKRQQQKIKKKR